MARQVQFYCSLAFKTNKIVSRKKTKYNIWRVIALKNLTFYFPDLQGNVNWSEN